MLTTFVIGRLVYPSQAPLRTFVANALILSSTACTAVYHFLAADPYRGIARSTKRDVQNGAVLGDVDGLPGKHGIDPLAQARLLGKLNEQLKRRPVMRFFE